MTAPMTKETLQAYRNRWRLVEAVEIAEQRAASIEQRWQQLNAVIQLAIDLQLKPQENRNTEQVRERWARLKGVEYNATRYTTKDGLPVSESHDIAHLHSTIGAVQQLLERFNNRGIVIGGVAASLLGTPRLTRDVDVTLLLDLNNVPELIRIASEVGLVARIADAAAFARKSRVLLLTHQASNVNVDVTLAALPFEEEAIERGIVHQVGTFSIRLPTPEDLIISKAIAHRPKDLEDIYNVIQTNPDLDRARIRSWVDEFAQFLEMPELWTDIAQWLEQ